MKIQITSVLQALVIIMGVLVINACNLEASKPTPTPVPSPIAPPPAPVSIQHQSIPIELPSEDSLTFGDQDTSPYAYRKIAPDGDRFLKGWFERPFNANTMDTYYPYLDILQVTIYQDAVWYFGTLQIKGTDEVQGFPATYGIELDHAPYGRGDYLILASTPAKGAWNTAGVQVWADNNHDVGNELIITSDPPQTGDGFEHLVFDEDKGGDPDMAWSRVVEPNTIQIAFKKSLLAGDTRLLVSAWAGMDKLTPAWFDLNDHFTHEQAGAADPGYPLFYPIKELDKIDNTCWMAIGFAASGGEPGLCPTYIPKEIGPTVAPPPPQQPPPPVPR